MRRERTAGAKGGFSLIELLVVVAIIAILASLLMVVSGSMMEKRTIARVTAEMRQLEAAIETYKDRFGYYPPDNTNNPAKNSLYYELTGTWSTNRGGTIEYRGVDDGLITDSQVFTHFGRGGILNNVPDPKRIRNFIPNLRASQSREIKTANANEDIEVLVVPADPINVATAFRSEDNKPINTWYYLSTEPTNNVSDFDLWAEIKVRGKTVIIGNWNY